MVTPARRGRVANPPPVEPGKPATPRHAAMNWAQRLKRVFSIESTPANGNLRIIAGIEEPTSWC